MCHQFSDPSWTPGDSARMKYGPEPGLGQYFIRALSPSVQLESKNKRYFSIAILHVDSEKKLEPLVFIFGAGFGRVSVSAPTMGGSVSRMWDKTNTLHIFFRILHKKLLDRNVSFIFRSELDASRYGGSRPM